MPLVGWVDTDDPAVAEVWPDSEQLVQETLELFLSAAYEQAVEFAPTLPDGEPIPDGWTIAQIMQASELWSASRREGDVIGYTDQVAVRSRPLGSTVKALLRPRPGVPRIG